MNRIFKLVETYPRSLSLGSQVITDDCIIESEGEYEYVTHCDENGHEIYPVDYFSRDEIENSKYWEEVTEKTIRIFSPMVVTIGAYDFTFTQKEGESMEDFKVRLQKQLDKEGIPVEVDL